MKILLINPRSDSEIRGPHPLKADDMGVFPHLGLMYIASVLKKEEVFEVELVDMVLEKISISELITIIDKFKPEVIGLTSYTDCLYDLKLTVEMLRSHNNDAFISVGGPHVEVYPEETLTTIPVDCIIRGDGEYSFRELCYSLLYNKSWKDVKGTGYVDKDNDKIILNNSWQIETLDELPFPARDLSSLERIKSSVTRGGAITSICSSRGCPFTCTFCNSPYKKYRLRSPENVAEEIVHCHKEYGIEEFFFFDDLFNISKTRLMEVCNVFKKLSFNFKWSFRGRVNSLDEEVLGRCMDVGCNRIHFGVEAGTERLQKIYKKNLDLNNIRKVFKDCHAIGIETVANVIIGGPGETREEIEQTLDFTYELDPTFTEFHVLVPYPYTEIYQDMIKNGTLEKDVWAEHARNPTPGFKPPLCEDTLSAKELYSLLNKAYRRFYFRPSYILKLILKLEGFSELWKKAWGAYRLLVVTRK